MESFFGLWSMDAASAGRRTFQVCVFEGDRVGLGYGSHKSLDIRHPAPIESVAILQTTRITHTFNPQWEDLWILSERLFVEFNSTLQTITDRYYTVPRPKFSATTSKFTLRPKRKSHLEPHHRSRRPQHGVYRSVLYHDENNRRY